MKKIYFLVALLFFCTEGFGQEVSQLHQYFTMNPMIKRDPLFQKVQQGIQKNVDGTKPGFNENVSTKLLQDLRLSISKIQINVELDKSGDLIINKQFLGKKKADTIPASNVTEVSISALVSNEFDKFLKSKINPAADPASGETEKLDYFILGRIAQALDPERNRAEGDAFDQIKRVIKMQVSALLKKLGLVALDQMSIKEKEEFVEDLNTRLRSFVGSKKDQLLEQLNMVESELGGFKEKINKTFAAANTGLSISSDEGNLGGGIYVGIKSDKGKKGGQFEFGAYVNGAGEVFEGDKGIETVTTGTDSSGIATSSEVDNNLNQPFLMGIALKWQLNPKLQANALGTFHWLSTPVGKKNSSWEVGCGFLYNTQSNIILGLSAFYQIIDEPIVVDGVTTNVNFSSVWSIGATVQNSTPGSPKIMVGITKENTFAKPIPTMQISYPVNLTKQ